jgi:hypothetical protein
MDRRKAALLCVLAAGVVFALLSPAHITAAQKDSALAEQIHEIASRPEYKHSTFGVEVHFMDRIFSRRVRRPNF